MAYSLACPLFAGLTTAYLQPSIVSSAHAFSTSCCCRIIVQLGSTPAPSPPFRRILFAFRPSSAPAIAFLHWYLPSTPPQRRRLQRLEAAVFKRRVRLVRAKREAAAAVRVGHVDVRVRVSRSGWQGVRRTGEARPACELNKLFFREYVFCSLPLGFDRPDRFFPTVALSVE